MTNNDKISLARNIAVISGIFSVLVALLLLLNYWQISQSDPVESKVLEALVERLNSDPANEELKTEIRNYDLLARKAYFNSQWQVKTGAYLLLTGCIVFAISLRLFYSLGAKIEKPDEVNENEIIGRILARKGVIIVAAVIFAFSVIASFFTVNHLERYKIQGVSSEESTVVRNEENIEVIDVDKSSADTTFVEDLQAEQDSGKIPETGNVQEENIALAGEEELRDSSDNALNITESGPAEEASLTVELMRSNHNSFRGPFSQGVIYHKNIPVDWDGVEKNSVIWKTPVPKKGLNSPVIWGDKLFLSGADEQVREVYCFNLANGQLLWTGRADNIPGSPAAPPGVTEDTGLAAPSVTTDGRSVFAIFATGDVISFTMTGERVWAKNLGVPDNHYGHSSSLIVWDNMLFVQYDTNTGGKVMALDSYTGNTVWETDRNVKISWASPLLAEVDGKYQLILTADPFVAGYDIKSGKELWAVDCMMGEVGPSVGFSNGVVYAANEYARIAAIDVRTHEIIWEDDYYLPEASSPVAHDGLLFVATSYGVIACYDARSGDMLWEDDIGTTIYSSPVYADGKLYVMDNEGVMRIYEFSKEKNLIGENTLGESTGTTPAFADGKIYIRGNKNLYCIGE